MGNTFDRAHRAKYAAEFTGAMFLTLIVKLSVAYSDYVTSLTIGLGLALLIYNFGYISGGHLNPSVTMALIVRNIPDFPLSERGMVLMYFISQYTGGICGGLIGWFIGGDKAAAVYPTVWQNPDEYDNINLLFQAFVGEIIFTSLLTGTVCYTATDKRQSGNQFYGLSIGLTVSIGAACIGPISGCCLNTAVYLGTVIPAIITGQTGNGITDLWVYWIGTFLGAIISALWFNIFNGKESVGDNGINEREELEQHLAIEDTQIE
eukprot:153210_1